VSELRDAIREIKALLAEMPPGPERDQRRGQLDRLAERLRALPRKVADQGPFKTRAEAHAVLTKEIAFVVAALDG
jgi:signal transduction histidine kinase